jgi:hypothetical protein
MKRVTVNGNRHIPVMIIHLEYTTKFFNANTMLKPLHIHFTTDHQMPHLLANGDVVSKFFLGEVHPSFTKYQSAIDQEKPFSIKAILGWYKTLWPCCGL